MTQRYRFGLVGHNISYTLSPIIFEALFAQQGDDGTFEVFDVSPKLLNTRLEDLRALDGFSVTVPYKHRLLKHLDTISKDAGKIGAVNSVKVENGQFHGYNTDADAFAAPLRDLPYGFDRILILGHGGAARAVLSALAREYPQSEIFVCGRDEQRVRQFVIDCSQSFAADVSVFPLIYKSISDGERYDLIVNCTPVGGVTGPRWSPLAENFLFHGCRVCYDLHYRPVRTILMNRAKRVGCRVIGGLSMLVRQAVASYTIWTQSKLDVDKVSFDIMRSLKI